MELDIDDPSIDCLQALLLLAIASTASGKGKKAYMLLGIYDFGGFIPIRLLIDLNSECARNGSCFGTA